MSVVLRFRIRISYINCNLHRTNQSHLGLTLVAALELSVISHDSHQETEFASCHRIVDVLFLIFF